MPALGIGYNPTLINQNLDTSIDDGNQWYENIDRSTTRLVPSENPNNYGSTYGISMNQNFGIPSTGVGNQFANARELMTSNPAYRGTFPGQRNIHEGFGTADVSTSFLPPQKTGIFQSLKNFGKSVLDNSMIGRVLGGVKDSFRNRPLGTSHVVDEFGNVHLSEDLDAQNALGGHYSEAARSARRAKSRYNAMMERRALGKKYSEINLAKMKAIIDQQRALDNQGYKGTPGGNTGSGAFAKFDNTTKDYGPHSKGGSNQSGGSFSGAGAGTGAQGPAGGQSSQGNYGGGRRDGPSGYKAHGGRIGYERGRVVNPGGYAGEEEFEEFQDEDTLEFMRDQGIPYGEMAETSAFDLRVQELVDEGMSWQEAWSIASKEFGLMAEGGESFSEEGIASIV